MEDKKKVVASKRDGWILIEDTWYPLLVSVYIHIRPHRHTQRYTDTVTQTDRYTSQRKGGGMRLFLELSCCSSDPDFGNTILQSMAPWHTDTTH